MAMYDISGSGTTLTIFASKTFPVGFEHGAFGKDNDPYDFPEVEIGDMEIDLNGNAYRWILQNPLEYTVSAAPATEEYENLRLIGEANTGVKSSRDVITLITKFPDGSTQSLLEGVMTSATLGKGVTSDGKLKPGSWTFKFTSAASTPATN